ncbi:hypothetical protein [Terrabacter sp. MAHUQ-38]|uniref:hypothetical protein n=1 Tax=unclassified Terrabacter TaxID=2630222 RepID=UPI00165E0707|nr:hypothetical protein [Terrabacter sp. MAHUQ-38]MBC9822820.1 hypothetical protein [Terrabacter sp. MAHUQ-38]
MSIAPTAYRVESHAQSLGVSVVPVTQLSRGDLVFDTDGMTHSLVSVELGMDSTVWIQRSDLPYVEHLTGAILVARNPSQLTPRPGTTAQRPRQQPEHGW